MRVLAASLLFAASALAQAPDADIITVAGLGPAGDESNFQATFLGIQDDVPSYDVTCTGTTDYCANGGFILSTDPEGYNIDTDVDGDGYLEKTSLCFVNAGTASCDIEIYATDDTLLSTAAPETRSGTITLTVSPGTTTMGEGPVSTTRTVDVPITSTLRSTVTVPSAGTALPTYAAPSGQDTSASVGVPTSLTTGRNLTAPTSTRPNAPVFTGAASGKRVGDVAGGTMGLVVAGVLGVAGLAFML
ncbi:hypothetical protein CAC42_2251 [Sphaceloma murrayae]|uniref:Uncharacterized protein n=1 Tax=Sphaceloma murrayae TaxID=2082308 RepID=A0A2K1QJE8_9PEZI|nr:hypothetical protein CAC42_2251 [Sphaceloma murrayae]